MRHDPDTRASGDDSRPQVLSAQLLRRRAVRSLLQSALVSTAVIVGYFVLPFTSPLSTSTAVLLFLGLAVVAALLTWQIRAITRSPYPRARTFTAMATTLPVFLVVFATTYFVMSRAEPNNFSEALSRLDSAYFTVTVFATVGFGDIVPLTAAARGVTTVQMLGDVVIVGLVAHVIVGAMREGLRRRGLDEDLEDRTDDDGVT